VSHASRRVSVLALVRRSSWPTLYGWVKATAPAGARKAGRSEAPRSIEDVRTCSLAPTTQGANRPST
jgi:hypothetical protein